MANSAELIVKTALAGIAGDRVFPDVAPEHTPRPYIVYQAVGGEDNNDLSGPVDLENARIQLAVWGDSRSQATATARAAFDALTAPEVGAIPIGAPVSVYEEDTKLRGSRRDYSIWFRP